MFSQMVLFFISCTRSLLNLLQQCTSSLIKDLLMFILANGEWGGVITQWETENPLKCLKFLLLNVTSVTQASFTPAKQRGKGQKCPCFYVTFLRVKKSFRKSYFPGREHTFKPCSAECCKELSSPKCLPKSRFSEKDLWRVNEQGMILILLSDFMMKIRGTSLNFEYLWETKIDKVLDLQFCSVCNQKNQKIVFIAYLHDVVTHVQGALCQ
jgi:hypothetical protein